MQLRQYQHNTVDAVNASTSKRICVVAPTGAGKTVIGASLLGGESACWMAHRTELVAQARAVLPPTCDVVTVQSRPVKKYPLVVHDECHHAPSEEWSKIVTDCVSDGGRLVGLTATPCRGDGAALGNIFDEMIVATTYSDLLRDGHLTQCEVVAPKKHVDGLACDPLDAYKQHSDGETCFAYARDVVTAHKFAKQFRDNGVSADVVDATTGEAARAKIFADFADGKINVLWSVYVCTEGVDVPHASVCLLARGCGHVGTYLQMAGRVLRRHESKKRALIIDLCGVSIDFGPPTIDRAYSLTGTAISGKPGAVRQCPSCGHADKWFPWPCPKCNFVDVEDTRKKIKIYNRSLAAVYDGEATPMDAKQYEWRRLLRTATRRGIPYSWCAKKYREQFGDWPFVDERQIISDVAGLSRKSDWWVPWAIRSLGSLKK
jgi:superfamily II DNA or RNA helicase